MQYPTVSIVIPTFNEGEWLTRTVRACLEKTNYPDFEIVVVADGCDDDSVAELKRQNWPNLRILELPKSVGAIQARNAGVKVAKGEVVVFIDSHQEPLSPDWLKVLVKLLAQPNAGAATINIADIDEPNRLGYLYILKDWALEPSWERPKEETNAAVCLAPAIPGGCFAMKKSLLVQTGGFNEHLKKWGREDFEYSLRLWRMGFDLYFSSDAIMGHAFNHKRAFEISWQQVDFNILYTAYTLMDQSAITQVEHQLQVERPQNFARVASEAKALASQALPGLETEFKRSFAAYHQHWINLPKA